MINETIIIAIEKLDENNLLRKRETVVRVRIVKDYYSEEDIQCLLATISSELEPVLRNYLNYVSP